MVMQHAADFLVGGSKPGEGNMPPPPPPPPKGCKFRDSNHRPLVLYTAVLPFDQQLYGGIMLPHLTPPHPPHPPPHPPQKSVIRF